MLDIGLIFARANARGFAGSTRGGVDEPGARLFALRAFELVRGTHFALFSLLAGLELIPTLLMSVLKQNKPQKKKHGFKTRMKTKDGRKIIKARRRKGRKQLGYGQ